MDTGSVNIGDAYSWTGGKNRVSENGTPIYPQVFEAHASPQVFPSVRKQQKWMEDEEGYC